MKKILVMPDGNWLAHTSRPLEVAKLLRQLGHDVVFAGEGSYMELHRKNGFQTFPIITFQVLSKDLAKVTSLGKGNKCIS